MALNCKAQAAITDAMYFLIIVMSLTTFTYLFIIPYGQSVDVHLSKEFRLSYASSALKSILYSSVARNPSDDIKTANEIDFFVTFLKEDYAEHSVNNSTDNSNEKLSEDTKKVLSKNIIHSMSFISASFDYVFFIRSTESTAPEFAFIFFKISYPGDEGENTAAYFYCSPTDNTSLNDFIEQELFPSLSDIAVTPSSIIFLPVYSDNDAIVTGTPDAESFEAKLAMWAPPTSKILESGLENFKNNFNCTDFDPNQETNQ